MFVWTCGNGVTSDSFLHFSVEMICRVRFLQGLEMWLWHCSRGKLFYSLHLIVSRLSLLPWPSRLLAAGLSMALASPCLFSQPSNKSLATTVLWRKFTDARASKGLSRVSFWIDQQEELIRKRCWPSTTASRAQAVDCCLGAGGRNSFSRCGSSGKQKRLLVQWGQAVQETGSVDQPDATSCCSSFPACGSVASSYMCKLYTKPALSNQPDSKSWYFPSWVIRLKSKASRRYQLASNLQVGEETNLVNLTEN